MRKLTAIFLLFSFIFGDAVHVNVLRLHGVVGHYQMHKKLDRNLGIVAFIKMHYQDNHGNSKIHTAHSKLPFKAGQQSGSFNLLCYDLPQVPTSLINTKNPLLVIEQIGYSSVLYRGFPLSLFHPPCFS